MRPPRDEGDFVASLGELGSQVSAYPAPAPKTAMRIVTSSERYRADHPFSLQPNGQAQQRRGHRRARSPRNRIMPRRLAAAPGSAHRSPDAPARPSLYGRGPQGRASGWTSRTKTMKDTARCHVIVARCGQATPSQMQFTSCAAMHTTVPESVPASTHSSRASVAASRTTLRTRATMSPSSRTTEQPLLTDHTVGSASPVEARIRGKALNSVHPPLDTSRTYKTRGRGRTTRPARGSRGIRRCRRSRRSRHRPERRWSAGFPRSCYLPFLTASVQLSPPASSFSSPSFRINRPLSGLYRSFFLIKSYYKAQGVLSGISTGNVTA